MEFIEIRDKADKLLMIVQLFFRRATYPNKKYFRNTFPNITCKRLLLVFS